jgi:hypothetical protein
MLSVIKGIEPRDQIEAMLAAQMAAVHMASMTFARRLANVENIPQQDSAERAFNKLTRTFAAQMSALKDYRSKGEQKMTIQHVHVAEGGQPNRRKLRFGWGTWIRTKIDGVRVRCSTVELSPNGRLKGRLRAPSVARQ